MYTSIQPQRILGISPYEFLRMVIAQYQVWIILTKEPQSCLLMRVTGPIFCRVRKVHHINAVVNRSASFFSFHFTINSSFVSPRTIFITWPIVVARVSSTLSLYIYQGCGSGSDSSEMQPLSLPLRSGIPNRGEILTREEFHKLGVCFKCNGGKGLS